MSLPITFTHSWYHRTTKPEGIMIGPRGYGDSEFKELELVATPPEWWRNGFYMDAECRCVMRRHGLRVSHDSRKLPTEPKVVYYGEINYQVPDHPFSDATKPQKLKHYA
jgi:hypothetical protein